MLLNIDRLNSKYLRKKQNGTLIIHVDEIALNLDAQQQPLFMCILIQFCMHLLSYVLATNWLRVHICDISWICVGLVLSTTRGALRIVLVCKWCAQCISIPRARIMWLRARTWQRDRSTCRTIWTKTNAEVCLMVCVIYHHSMIDIRHHISWHLIVH